MNPRLFIISCLFLVPLLTSPFTMQYPHFLLRGRLKLTPLPTFSTDSFLNKTYQQELEAWASENFGLRALFIVVNNTLYYTLLQKIYSANPEGETWVGQHRWLYTRGYVIDYMKPTPNAATLEQRIIELRWLQDELARRGKTFLIHITPSKVARYPEHLPRRFFLLGYYQPGYTYNRSYILLKSLLDKHQLHRVDNADALGSQKLREPQQLLFPQGGIHWNTRGCYVGASNFINVLEALIDKPLRHPVITEITWDNTPVGEEKDLAVTLNTFPSPTLYRTEHLTFLASNDSLRRHPVRPTVAIVGTSFNWKFIDLLSAIDFYKRLSFFYYLRRVHTVYEHGQEVSRIEDTQEPIPSFIPRLIENHQVVVLEINENAVADLENNNSYSSTFIREAINYLKKHPH